MRARLTLVVLAGAVLAGPSGAQPEQEPTVIVFEVTHLAQPTSAGPTDPAWTPDGRRILFGFHYEDNRPEYEDRYRLAVVDVSGRGFRFVTPPSYDAFTPDAATG